MKLIDYVITQQSKAVGHIIRADDIDLVNTITIDMNNSILLCRWRLEEMLLPNYILMTTVNLIRTDTSNDYNQKAF